MYYMQNPNQNYFNGDIPTYRGNQPQQIIYGNQDYNTQVEYPQEQPLYLQNNYNPYYNQYDRRYQGYNNPYNVEFRTRYIDNNYRNDQYDYYNQVDGELNDMGYYYNPYSPIQSRINYYEEQRKDQEAMFLAMKLFTKLALDVNVSLDDPELEKETLKRYYPQEYANRYPQEQPELSEEEKNFNRLNEQNIQQAMLSRYATPYVDPVKMGFFKVMKEIEDIYYGAEDLFDWMTIEDEQIKLRRERELQKQERNLSTLYDSNRYNNLLQQHRRQSVAFKNNINVDDFTIELPEYLKNKYSERRAKFIDAIISKMNR